MTGDPIREDIGPCPECGATWFDNAYPSQCCLNHWRPRRLVKRPRIVIDGRCPDCGNWTTTTTCPTCREQDAMEQEWSE